MNSESSFGQPNDILESEPDLSALTLWHLLIQLQAPLEWSFVQEQFAYWFAPS